MIQESITRKEETGTEMKTEVRQEKSRKKIFGEKERKDGRKKEKESERERERKRVTNRRRAKSNYMPHVVTVVMNILFFLFFCLSCFLPLPL